MKAFKLYKIRWNLENLTNEEKSKVLETLPTEMGFTTSDKFCSVRIPDILKKKYGYEIIDFSFTELRVVENVEDLLKICKPNEKEKEIFNIMSGNISSYGKKCLANLEWYIKRRLQMEREGKSEWEMPSILDEVMIGIEKVTGMEWGNHTVDEMMNPIKKLIRGISHKSKVLVVEEEENEEYEEYEE